MFFGFLLFLVIVFLISKFWRKVRKGSFESRVQTLLDTAVNQNIISADQSLGVQALLPPSATGFMTSGRAALMLGGMFVLTGVSLLIAHNWDSIPETTRVYTFCMITLGLGYAYYKFETQSPLLSLVLELFLFFWPILGIALYGQTFQLSNDPIKPYLTWFFLSLPLACFTSHQFLRICHLLLTGTLLFYGNFTSGALSLLENSLTLHSCILTLVLLMALTWHFLKLNPLQEGLHIATVCAWSFSLFFFKTPLHAGHNPALIVLATALAVIAMILTIKFEKTLTYTNLGAWAWVLGVYSFTFLWHADTSFDQRGSMNAPWLITVVVWVATLFCAVLYKFEELKFSPKELWIFKSFIIVSLLFAMSTYGLDYAALKWIGLLSNFILGGMAILLLIFGAQQKRQRAINIGISLLALLLITRVIDVWGNMIRSGFGFIVCGLFLTALGYALSKGRTRLLERIEHTEKVS